MTDPRLLPPWAEDLRRRYLRGEASMFVLHGNVYDGVIHQQKMRTLAEFLTDVLLKDARDTIAVYNIATGVRFAKRQAAAMAGLDDLLLASQKDKVLAALERLLVGSMRAAVVIEYAEAVAPAGDPDVPGRLRPRGRRDAAPLVVPARDRARRQRRHPDRREPQRDRAEDRVEPQGGGHPGADARPRDPEGRGAARGRQADRPGRRPVRGGDGGPQVDPDRRRF